MTCDSVCSTYSKTICRQSSVNKHDKAPTQNAFHIVDADPPTLYVALDIKQTTAIRNGECRLLDFKESHRLYNI